MIYANEITQNSQLHPQMQMVLFNVAVAAEQGHQVSVHLVMSEKETDTPARQPGQDFVQIPSLPSGTHIGTIYVDRYVDNAKNRKLERVGTLYFRMKSITRANGFKPYGWVSIRVHQIVSIVQLGVESPTEEQMATRALAEAAQAQTTQAPTGA